MAYPTRDTIELVHGSKNIRIWADLDNEKNSQTIQSRIDWSADLSTEYVNGRLILGKYTIPFAAVPKMVIHLSSLLAGVLLHDGRPTNEASRDQVYPKRKDFRRLLREVISGQLRLVHPTSGAIIESTCYSAPFVIGSTIGALNTTLCSCERITGSGFCNYCWPYVTSAWCNDCRCHTCICRSLFLPTW